MGKTDIEWADKVWNPVTGCTQISPGCDNCYAKRLAPRLAGRHGYPEAPNQFDVTLHPDKLEQPLHWDKPQTIFICSMGDLFHKQVPDHFIVRVVHVIQRCPQHRFIMLTKRAIRMEDFFYEYYPKGSQVPDNLYIGISAETQYLLDLRMERLSKIEGIHKLVSLEPALGPMNLRRWIDREDIDWVIMGGESGSDARPLNPAHVRWVRDQCKEMNVPFMFKQWGEFCPPSQMSKETKAEWEITDYKKHPGLKWDDRDHDRPELGKVGKKKAGRKLDGLEYMEVPK